MSNPAPPDPTSPSSVAFASFSTARRGFDTDEVRAFLHAVAAEMTRLEHQVSDLRRQIASTPAPAPAPEPARVDEDTIAALLGEETARIVQTAREAAAQIKARAEETAAKLVRDASEEASRLRSAAELDMARRRSDAAADAEAEIEMARQQGRDMVNEAREYREKVLADTSRRRDAARAQIEALVHGRDRLVNAFERARLAAVDVISELTPLGEEPAEFVNLSPTTGPVPVVTGAPVPPDRTTGQVADADEPAPLMYDVEDEPAAEWADATDGPDVPSVDVDADPDDTVGDDDLSGVAADAADDTTDVEALLADDATDDDGLLDDEDIDDEDIDDEDIDDEDIDEDIDDGEVPSDTAGDDRVLDSIEPMGDDVASADDAPVVEHPGGDLLHLPPLDDDNDLDDEYDDFDDDDPRPTAPVVSLFAGESSASAVEPDEGMVAARPSVDDLFARLRRSSAAVVAQEATDALAAQASDDSSHVVDDETSGSGDTAENPDAGEPPLHELPTVEVPVVPTGHRASGLEKALALAEPTADPSPMEEVSHDGIFAERDAELVPLVVASARKLKRVLADEQNDVLDSLRRTRSIERLDALLPIEADQTERYLQATREELLSAATVGATALGGDPEVAVSLASLLDPVGELVAADIVRPLRERLDRAVMQVGEDTDELATLVRNIYREWKTQRIDEHVEDIVRLAHGRGAYAALTPGRAVCWRVDPNGPPCADAEDNSLAGVVAAGDPFPTGHTHPPMHAGCRCLLETTPG